VLNKQQKEKAPPHLRGRRQVGCTSREKQGGTTSRLKKTYFTSQPLTALLGAACRSGTAHVVTFGPIRIARDLKQALPNLDDSS
jgi:hypothetical protein